MRSWAGEKRKRVRTRQVAQVLTLLGTGVAPATRVERLRSFSPAEFAFIKTHYQWLNLEDLTREFNCVFAEEKTQGKIKSLIHNQRIVSGRTGCFEKGVRPWNAGTKGQGLTGANRNSFKVGSVPANRKPLGAERVCSKDGFILIKVPERNPYTGFSTRYKHKHVHIWEQHHGPVPEGFVVAFKDSDKRNCEPDNLMLISRAELLRLNQNGYREIPEELKPSLLTLVKVEVKAFSLRKGK